MNVKRAMSEPVRSTSRPQLLPASPFLSLGHLSLRGRRDVRNGVGGGNRDSAFDMYNYATNLQSDQ